MSPQSPVFERSFLTKPLHSEDRWLCALALAVTAATHIPLIHEHMEEAPYIGWLFVLLSAVSVVLAVLVVLADSRAVWLASGVVTLLAVLAFFWSRTLGFPEIGDDIGNWTEPLGFPAVVAELIAAWVAYVVLWPRSQRSAQAPQPPSTSSF